MTGEIVETSDDDAVGTVIPDAGILDGIIYSAQGPDASGGRPLPGAQPAQFLGNVSDGFFSSGETMQFRFPGPRRRLRMSIDTFAADTGAYSATTGLGDVALSF